MYACINSDFGYCWRRALCSTAAARTEKRTTAQRAYITQSAKWPHSNVNNHILDHMDCVKLIRCICIFAGRRFVSPRRGSFYELLVSGVGTAERVGSRTNLLGCACVSTMLHILHVCCVISPLTIFVSGIPCIQAFLHRSVCWLNAYYVSFCRVYV